MLGLLAVLAFIALNGFFVAAEFSLVKLRATYQGEKPKDWRTSMYYRYYHYPQHHRVQPHYGVRTERYKLIYFNKIDQWELYDLQKDPREMRNIVNDPGQAETVKKLKEEMYRLKKELKDENQFEKEVPKDDVSVPLNRF